MSTWSATEQPLVHPIPAPTATYNEAFDIRVRPDDVEHTSPQEALDENMPKVLQLAHMQSSATVSCTTDDGLESFDRRLCTEEVKGETEKETEEHDASAVTVGVRRGPAAEPHGNAMEGGSSSVKGSQEVRGATSRMKIPTPRTSIDRPTRKGLDEERSPKAATSTQLPAPRPSLERPTRKTMDETETLASEQFKQEVTKTPATHSQKSESIATEKAPVTAHAPEWTNVEVYSTVSAVGGVSESQQDERVAVEKVPASTPPSEGVPTNVGIHSTVSAAGGASEITPAIDTTYSEKGESASAVDNALVTTHVPEGASANVGVQLTVSAVGDESEIAPAADNVRSREDEIIAAENVLATTHASGETSIVDDVHDTAGAVSTTEEVQERTIAESKLDDIDKEQAQSAPSSALENPRQVNVSTATARAERGNVKAARRRHMRSRSHSTRTESHVSDDAYAKFSDDDEHVPVCSKLSCVIC